MLRRFLTASSSTLDYLARGIAATSFLGLIIAFLANLVNGWLREHLERAPAGPPDAEAAEAAVDEDDVADHGDA